MMRLLTALMMLLFVFVVSAGAQTGGGADTNKEHKRYIYEWTDSKGGVHITDDLGEVPERYRSKVRSVEMPKGQEAGPVQQETTRSIPGGTREADEAASKAAWQQRLRDWKTKLAGAQERYRELDQRRLEVLGKWGGPASGHLEGRAEAEQIAEEMKGVQREIDEARNMIETIIPEEARRAGIPPGWLRE